MGIDLNSLRNFLEKQTCVLVRTVRVKGSTPRENGAWMLVGESDILGTIGGGQLEYIGIDTARQMLRSEQKSLGQENRELDIPLGPDIGQCCGGRVGLKLLHVTLKISQDLVTQVERERAEYRHVYIMGAGHVGRALASALAPLPFRTIVVDTRAEALAGLPENIETRLSALPEAEVKAAPAQSVFVVLTHDHALDFMIVRAALERGDVAYIGMIGSRTKRARFMSWAAREGVCKNTLKPLICPIGGEKPGDKRPEVIGALVASEILVHTGEKKKSKKFVLDHPGREMSDAE